MISDKSLEPLIWCFELSSLFLICPYYWNHEGLGLRTAKDPIRRRRIAYWVGKVQMLLLIAAHLVYCVFLLFRFVYIRPSLTPSEIIIAIFFISVSLMSVSQHCFNILSSSEYHFYFTSLIRLNKKSAGVLGSRNQNEPDGLEVLNRILFIIPVISMVVGAPGATYAALNGLPYFRIFWLENLWLTMGHLVLVMGTCIANWLVVLAMVLTTLIDTNSTYKWIRKSNQAWCRSNLTKSEKSVLRILYRSYQIRHTITVQLVRFTLPIVIPVAEFLLVTSVYSVLRLLRSSDPIVSAGIAAVGLFTGIVLKVAIEVAVRVTESSKGILRLRNSKKPFSKDDIQFFKSCRPFIWTIGNSFTLTKDTFVKIIDSIVISAVISLLVTF